MSQDLYELSVKMIAVCLILSTLAWAAPDTKTETLKFKTAGREFTLTYEVDRDKQVVSEFARTYTRPYSRIRLSSPGLAAMKIDQVDREIEGNSGQEIPRKFASLNSVKSPYFLVLPLEPSRSLLILFGQPIASQAGALWVLALGKDGIKVVLHEESLELVALEKPGDAATFKLIAGPSSEGLCRNPEITTYDPKTVYRW